MCGPGRFPWLYFYSIEIGMLKDVTDSTKEKLSPQWEKLFGSIPWMIVTQMQLRQPKNVVEATQVFSQCRQTILQYDYLRQPQRE